MQFICVFLIFIFLMLIVIKLSSIYLIESTDRLIEDVINEINNKNI